MTETQSTSTRKPLRRFARKEKLEIRARHRRRESMAAIARHFGCDDEAVRYWVRAKSVPRDVVMPEPTPEGRPLGKRVPQDVRARIKQLWRESKSAAYIMRACNVTFNTVVAWRERRLRVFPEKKILKLLAQGLAPTTIARRLKYPRRTVVKFARQNGFASPLRPWTAEQLAVVSKDILARRGTAAAIAKRHRVSYKKTLALAHVLLECQRFIPSEKWPLESYYPSKLSQSPFADAKQEPDVFVTSLQNLLNGMFGGKFPYGPVHDALFVRAMLTGLAEKLAPPQEVLEVVGAGLTRAVSALRGQEQWVN